MQTARSYRYKHIYEEGELEEDATCLREQKADVSCVLSKSKENGIL
jgi:hypothetical protein